MGILIAFPLSSLTQEMENRLNSWAQQNPIEKLYLHIDRENYYAGQTFWGKGYFMSGFLPSTSSTALYVELLNSRSELILRNVFPVYGGMAPVQLTLPDSLSTNLYQIRAYTPLMLNQSGFTFSRYIKVYGKENKRVNNSELQTNNKLIFFPEGGNFITGLLNIVAFKSMDKSGVPLPVEGNIRNSKNELICRFKSVHDGMGSFSIVPIKGETYYAMTNQSEQKYFLPPQADDGIVFNITDAPGMKRFKIVQGGQNDLFKPAYMIGQVQNTIIFKQWLQGDKKEIIGSVKTNDLYSGILQLTLFNKDNMPLAERITFVDNKEYVLPAGLNVDTLDTGKRKHNHFTLVLPDTLIGNFSLSITDADYESSENRPFNIYSSFLLSSDIKGYIHNPSYYFNTPVDSVKNALELVMMTNGWTRFKWSDVIHNKLPKPLYKDPGYIKLSGKVNIAGTKKPIADKDILLFIAPADSVGIAKGTSVLLHTDSSGRFKADSLIFYGKMKMLFSEVRGRKNEFIRVLLDGDSLTRTYPIAPDPMPFPEKNSTVAQHKMDVAYKEYINAKGITLENVTVRAIEKSPLDKLDEEYSSGYFSGATHSTRLDVRNETYAGDIFQYLRERIPGLKISFETGDYVLHYRGGNLSYYVNNGVDSPGNVTLFLNEMPSNTVVLETVPLNEIALVKLFPTSTAAPGGGAALAIYTKKGRDSFMPTATATDIVTYQGYTIIKEFYNPEYEGASENSTSNRRITLKWIPDIIVTGSNTSIPVTFYNNDRTKRFKIVAEGITSEGRILMLEKIIGPR